MDPDLAEVEGDATQVEGDRGAPGDGGVHQDHLLEGQQVCELGGEGLEVEHARHGRVENLHGEGALLLAEQWRGEERQGE